MAKARKRMKESSVQTEQTKTDAVTTVADLTGGKYIMCNAMQATYYF